MSIVETKLAENPTPATPAPIAQTPAPAPQPVQENPRGKTRWEKWKEKRAADKIKKAAEDKVFQKVFDEEYAKARVIAVQEQAREKAQIKAKGGSGFAGALTSISTALSQTSDTLEKTGLAGMARQGGFLSDQDIFGTAPRKERPRGRQTRKQKRERRERRKGSKTIVIKLDK